MAHGHTHDHAGFYAEQICTVVISGALGAVASILYLQGTLRFMLAEKFHIWVLLGGITLLALAIVRVMGLGRALAARRVGQNHAGLHEHGHEHPAEDHHHHKDRGHCDHGHAQEHEFQPVAADCDHGHDHGWSPWRYALLLLPIVLFLLQLPNQGFSSMKEMDVTGLDTGRQKVLSKEKVIHLSAYDLGRAANRPEERDYYEGATGVIQGQLVPKGDDGRLFTLVRYKMACCAADAVPINVLIVTADPVTHVQAGDWVEVSGQMQFRARGREFVPVIQVSENQDIRSIPPQGFLQS